MIKLSHLVITKNSGELLDASLASTRGLADEIVMVDDSSTDNTGAVADKYGAVVHKRKGNDLGRQRAYGLDKCRGAWVLMLDADETVSDELKKEIISILDSASTVSSGYYIPYQNYFLGKPICYGGEDYKILRLFKKGAAAIEDNEVHEHVAVQGVTGQLKGKIHHYSYRTLPQTYFKFTEYAKREARRKLSKGEGTGLSKLLMYPAHMFWARYVKDKGYKDYSLRILLDLGFAYMEFLTYLLMFFYGKVNKKA